MSDAIIVALISAGLPIVATVLTTAIRGRASARHNAQQSIFQMIMEDHLAVAEHRIPTNYQNILHEYDIYHRNGGNSYVTEKVENYKTWFIKVQGGTK